MPRSAMGNTPLAGRLQVRLLPGHIVSGGFMKALFIIIALSLALGGCKEQEGNYLIIESDILQFNSGVICPHCERSMYE